MQTRRRAGLRSFPGLASCRISLSSVRSAIALRSRVFSVSRSFSRLTWSLLSPPNSWRQREYVTSVTPIERTASATLCPCDTSTSTWRSFATISSGLCLFLGIVVLLGSKAIPQGGPLQRGRITLAAASEYDSALACTFRGGASRFVVTGNYVKREGTLLRRDGTVARAHVSWDMGRSPLRLAVLV